MRKELNPQQKARGRRLARLIKRAREKLPLTQEELARQSGIGIDHVKSIECGRVYTPNAFVIADLAKILKGDLKKWLK